MAGDAGIHLSKEYLKDDTCLCFISVFVGLLRFPIIL